MAEQALLDTLVALEVELHRGATRADRARMDALLHPQFLEIGRCGDVWTREATLAEFAAGDAAAPRIAADRFALQPLHDTLTLLTYRSAHLDAQGVRQRFTLRSSLWQRDAAGPWRLRFHQGTPTEDDSP